MTAIPTATLSSMYELSVIENCNAAFYGHLNVCRFLLEEGADNNAVHFRKAPYTTND